MAAECPDPYTPPRCRSILNDYALFAPCLTGPEGGVRAICAAANLDCDNDIDLRDFTRFPALRTHNPLVG